MLQCVVHVAWSGLICTFFGCRLCLSISDFHPDTWNPAWSVSTILTGLLSFMVSWLQRYFAVIANSIRLFDVSNKYWLWLSLSFLLQWVSVGVSLYLSISVCVCLSSLQMCLCPSVCLSFCLCLSVFHYDSLFVSLPAVLCQLFTYTSVCLSACLSALYLLL